MYQKIKIVKRILILGATTPTGKWAVKRALDADLKVNVLVEDISKLDWAVLLRLKVFEGDSTNYQDLAAALSGCDSVINALTVSRVTLFPWSSLSTRPDLLSATMRQLIPLCRKLSVGHIVVVSAWGAGDSRQQLPGWFRWLIDHSNMRYTYADHERQEEILIKSDLDFTIVRPSCPSSLAGSKLVLVSINGQPKPNLLISRQSLAHFAVSALNRTYNCQTLVISSF